MNPAEVNAIKHVTRRVDEMDLEDAIDITAIETGLDREQIDRAWHSFDINPVQERIINFLKRDHGSCKMVSLLPNHPLARELDLQPRRHIFIQFPHESFVIHSDGGFSPATWQVE